MITHNRLPKLFAKMRDRLINNNKFFLLADKLSNQLSNAYFMNIGQVICLYNDIGSIPINKIISDRTYYYNNTFVFPKLMNGTVHFYLVSSPEDLFIDVFGAQDVKEDCFKIRAEEIDVTLMSGLAYDIDMNCRVANDNVTLYKEIIEQSNSTLIGLGFGCQLYKKSGELDTHFELDGLLTENGFNW